MNYNTTSSNYLGTFESELTGSSPYDGNILIVDELLSCIDHLQEVLHEHFRRVEVSDIASRLLDDCENIVLCLLRCKSENPLFYSRLGELLPLEKRVRALLRMVPSLVLADEWMSPSTEHSVCAQRGHYCEYVVPASFDYKRDRHKEAEDYEAKYVAEIMEMSSVHDVRSFVCSSGMSAISTILNFLKYQGILTKSVMVPKSLYYETTTLLEGICRESVLLSDADSEVALLDDVFKEEPKVLFLEGIANSQFLSKFDLDCFFGKLNSLYKKDIYIVLDLTTTPLCTLDKFMKTSIASNLRVIVVESLAKFYQCGLDIATGGIVSFLKGGEVVEDFIAFREKFGSNHSDIACLSLPRPSSMLIRRRFALTCKNARYLFDHLNSFQLEGCSFVGSEPLSGSLGDGTMLGTPIININFSERISKNRYHVFLRNLMQRSEALGVQVLEGTSFGFNASRISLVGPSSESPFVRFSVGTESQKELRAIGDALIDSVRGSS